MTSRPLTQERIRDLTEAYFEALQAHKSVKGIDTPHVLSLIEKGANVNAVYNDFTALTEAVCAGNAEIVKALVARGANLDAKNRNDNTALHWAVIHRNKPMVDLLLSLGADTEAQNLGGTTPLQQAINTKRPEIAKALEACRLSRALSEISRARLSEPLVLLNPVRPKFARRQP